MQEYRKNLGKVSLTTEGAWAKDKSFDILSIVYDEHTLHGFISKQFVPKGVDLYNKEYWMPFNVSGYADNNIIILSEKTSETSIKAYTLEEAINSVATVGRRPGMILGFYNENTDRLDIGGRWEIWQFNSTTISEWEDVAHWQNIYYSFNKFVGWYRDVESLKKYNPFPEIGCYAYVGTEFNEATIYRCDTKFIWTDTTQHAWDYIKVIFQGNVTVGENGNWFNDGVDTGIPASIKGENGKTPVFRQYDNTIQYSFDNTNWITISDKVAAWFRWNATTGDTQANNVGRIQISRDNVTWTNLSGDIINKLHISRYIGADESLPASGIAEGTIYAKGPYYAEDDTLNDNPIYRLWVYAWKGDTLAWQDNGEFTSIAAGVVQETGNSETEVMSQKATTEKLTELATYIGKPIIHTILNVGLWNIPINIKVGDVFNIRSLSSSGAVTIKTYDSQGGEVEIISSSFNYDGNVTFTAKADAMSIGGYCNTAGFILQITKQNNAIKESYDNILAQINQLRNEGYLLVGVASLADSNQKPNEKVMKIASMEGVYSGYNNLRVYSNEIAIFYYVNNAWGKISVGSYKRGISENAQLSAIVKELVIPNVSPSSIEKIVIAYAAPTGQNFYNALYYYINGSGYQVFQDIYATKEDCVANAVGLKGKNSNYAVVDLSNANFGGSVEFLNPKLIADLSIEANPQVFITTKFPLLESSTIPLTDNILFNKVVKEIYLKGIDINAINSISCHYGRETGNRYYNALYAFTDNGNYNVFTEYYNTQEECKGSLGIKWNYSENIGALIDFSELGVMGVVYEFNNIKFNHPLTYEWLPKLGSYHQKNSSWKHTDWWKVMFDKCICIGDSVTEGNIYDYPNHVGVVSKLSYPNQLSKLTNWEVENAGESGITTLNWWKNKFANYNYADYDVCFIALGYNGGLTDTLESDAPSGTAYNNYADTNTGRFCSIIEGILEQNPQIIINIVVNSRIKFMSEATYNVLKKIGLRYSLAVIDLTDTSYYDLNNRMYHGYDNVTDMNNNAVDYIHYNAVGYAAMAHCVLSSFGEFCDKNAKLINDNHIYSSPK